MATTRESKTTTVKLDWSRLLGFDQADRHADHPEAAKLNDPRMAKVGQQKAGINKAGIRWTA
jgi:hypothetical protein